MMCRVTVYGVMHCSRCVDTDSATDLSLYSVGNSAFARNEVARV